MRHVNHRTSIAEATDSNPVEALIFFRLLLSNCLNWKICCEDHSSLSSTTAVQMWIISYRLHKLSQLQNTQLNLLTVTFLAILKWTAINHRWLFVDGSVKEAKDWRLSLNLHRPFSRTNYGRARFSVMASQIWETIPMNIKCLAFNSFKKEYKLFLL